MVELRPQSIMVKLHTYMHAMQGATRTLTNISAVFMLKITYQSCLIEHVHLLEEVSDMPT